MKPTKFMIEKKLLDEAKHCNPANDNYVTVYGEEYVISQATAWSNEEQWFMLTVTKGDKGICTIEQNQSMYPKITAKVYERYI